jgi:hypothetical protein
MLMIKQRESLRAMAYRHQLAAIADTGPDRGRWQARLAL